MFVLREGIALYAYTRSGSKFSFDAITQQINAVVTRSGGFVLVREIGERQAVICLNTLVKSTIGGHNEYIVEVASPRTRKVGMRKASNDAIGVEITRNSIPTWDTYIRTELHHPKGRHCPRVGIPRPISTNERINIISEFFFN